MRKSILFILASLVLCVVLCFSACTGDKTNTVKVNEVTHSVFYAPQYAAMALGYFEEEGLNIELTNGGGADKTMAAVLSGDADIGLCGPEATIYVYKQGNEDYAQSFAQLTQCDGSFIIAREPNDNFEISDLKGSHIIAGRKGGMPVMVLEWILKNNGLDLSKDVYVDTSVTFNAMAGAFIGGNGDYVSLFEPTATLLVNENKGYVVMSLGEKSGRIPYTAYNAKKSYIQKRPDIIKAFTKALNKGQKYVANNSAKDIAECISGFFPDTDKADIERAIESYKSIGAYAESTYFSQESFDLLQNIIMEAGELSEHVDYDKLVYTKYMD